LILRGVKIGFLTSKAQRFSKDPKGMKSGRASAKRQRSRAFRYNLFAGTSTSLSGRQKGFSLQSLTRHKPELLKAGRILIKTKNAKNFVLFAFFLGVLCG